MDRGKARPKVRRIAFSAFCTFLVLAAGIAGLASLTMLWPHSALAVIWAPKASAFRALLQHRIPMFAGFALLSAALAAAASGWHRRRRWAWGLAALILAANLLSDLVAAAVTRHWANLLGAVIEALVLTWLLSPATRKGFPGR